MPESKDIEAYLNMLKRFREVERVKAPNHPWHHKFFVQTLLSCRTRKNRTAFKYCPKCGQAWEEIS